MSAEISAKDLGIEDIYQNAHDKLEAYDHLLEKRNLTDDEICVVGDDLTVTNTRILSRAIDGRIGVTNG